MRAHTTQSLAGDQRKPAGRPTFGFGHRAERRTADVHDRRLSTQLERVGSSFIVVTCFD
ncbi:MAG TPA: hypothetical protein VGH48_04620 [Caldimonas sp.]|jgi:hypothetical protein